MKKIIVLLFMLSMSLCLISCSSSSNTTVNTTDTIKEISITTSLDLVMTEKVLLDVVNTTGGVELEWLSSNVYVASVSDGVVTGVSPGACVISVQVDGYIDYCMVKVTEDFLISSSAESISVGGVMTLTASTKDDGLVEWSNRDSSIASTKVVGNTVVIEGLSAGTTVIYATYNDKTISCVVTVG